MKPHVYEMDALINEVADSIIDIAKQVLAQIHAEIDISSPLLFIILQPTEGF